MEKDRDKRFADMDAFYRALGAAGGVPFEPSNVFVPPPQASLKYPTLAAPSAAARASKTAVAPLPGTERSKTSARGASMRPPGGMSRGVKIGAAVGSWPPASSRSRWPCAAAARPAPAPTPSTAP